MSDYKKIISKKWSEHTPTFDAVVNSRVLWMLLDPVKAIKEEAE